GNRNSRARSRNWNGFGKSFGRSRGSCTGRTMTARTRLILTVTGSALLLVIPALYGMLQLAELRDIALELRGRHAAASVDLGLLQAELARLERFQRSYIATPQPELLEGMQDALAHARERVEDL